MTLFGKITLTEPNGSSYTLGSELLGFSLHLDQELAHKATISVSDPNSIYSDQYVLGSDVEIFCDQTNPPATKVFRGYVEEREVKQSVKTRKLLSMTCAEYFHVVASGIQVAERYFNTKAGAVVRDLVGKYTPEFDTTNVQDTDSTLEEIVLDYMSLIDAIDELARLSLSHYYVQPQTRSSTSIPARRWKMLSR